MSKDDKKREYQPKRCRRSMGWAGQCVEAAVTEDDFCEKHLQDNCWCGRTATNECAVAVSLCCGAPLCDEHRGQCPRHDQDVKQREIK